MCTLKEKSRLAVKKYFNFVWSLDYLKDLDKICFDEGEIKSKQKHIFLRAWLFDNIVTNF
jgi:hypothetical protein